MFYLNQKKYKNEKNLAEAQVPGTGDVCVVCSTSFRKCALTHCRRRHPRRRSSCSEFTEISHLD